MAWGKPNTHWIKFREVEPLPDAGCSMCFVTEKLLAGSGDATYILQHHSPDFKCGCHLYPARVRLAHHDLSVTCETHKAMMEHVLQLYNNFSQKMVACRAYAHHYPAHGVELSLSCQGVPTITVLDSKCQGKKSYEFVLRKPPNADASPRETTIDISWVDLASATAWKDKCVHRQSINCRESDRGAVVAPHWLIDTQQDCLVRGNLSMEYVALSYRCGSPIGTRVTLAELDHLQEPGSLADSPIAQVPIVRDAMHVVKNIQERYLWVDAACIVHDDRGHVLHQIQAMGSIYASAKLTIISTDGDAMDGLPGLQHCSPPRKLEGIFPWTDNREIFVRDVPCINSLFVPDYFKRGWTLQEYVLSHRRLIFGRQQMQWTCHCGTWHEDLPKLRSPLDDANQSIVHSSNILRHHPDLNVLGNVLRSYNNLGLTYPEDALPAIAGLLKLFAPAFKGGFLYGLPVMCFEAALLWGTRFWYYGSSGVKYRGLTRRQHSGRTPGLLPNAELPSWSWVGWKSDALSILRDEEDFQVVTYPGQPQEPLSRMEKWTTIPTVHWFCQDTPEVGGDRERIRSCWSAPHLDLEPLDGQLAAGGWTREAYPGANGPDVANTRSIPFGLSGAHVYSHPAYPNRLFWRTFSVDGGRGAPQMRQRRFLSCTTQRAFFPCVRKTGCTLEAGAMDFHLELRDGDGGVCGWVQLATADAALPTLADGQCSDSDYEMVELVVVCRRLYSESIDERGEWLHRRDYTLFYGVLCIEWRDGVAYRKGFGYVKQEIWDHHDFDTIDLVLG